MRGAVCTAALRKEEVEDWHRRVIVGVGVTFVLHTYVTHTHVTHTRDTHTVAR